MKDFNMSEELTRVQAGWYEQSKDAVYNLKDVTKALTDGKSLKHCKRMVEDIPGIGLSQRTQEYLQVALSCKRMENFSKCLFKAYQIQTRNAASLKKDS
ncbi:hypothetical protein ValLY3_91 [Vibrio phage ValLY_3]|uniref:Uncharacterized protein n=1 Tax=Vibrio phage ValLY_3 TaxID=2484244 RepID=A0A411BJQ4_9CAUD|nr:hypothetical protein ValLY3_91 [Vibrio phage ValLY_3]